MLRGNLTLVLAAIALVLAGVQAVHPFGVRVHPGLLMIVAALLVLRHLMRRQRMNRDAMVKAVPEHPLGLSEGLSDKSDQRTNE